MGNKKILIACEFSGNVRNAFLGEGHNACSVDILSSLKNGPHIKGDVLDILNQKWDMMIGFPPCTDLAISGARWFPEKIKNGSQQKSINFFMSLINAPIKHIAIENPVGIMSTKYRKPDQIIQPWMFGHGETKKTCLWLKNLPLLQSTDVVNGRNPRVHHEAPGPERWKKRSITLPGIAMAMAKQWGAYI